MDHVCATNFVGGPLWETARNNKRISLLDGLF
jgi:hypothetical protein